MRRVHVLLATALFLGTAGVASAGDPKTDAITEEARQLFDAGLVLYRDKQWDRARVKFLAAWSLKKHYQIAGNLGDCELQVGRHREAAEHLDHAVRLGAKDGADAADVERLRGLLATARAKVGTLMIKVDRAGADVAVDGASVGKSPLESDVFVDPGKHRVMATVAGVAAAESTADVAAGQSREVSLRFEGPTQGPGDPPPGASETKGAPTWPIYVGAGTTAVLVGVAVTSLVIATGKQGDADDRRDQLRGQNVSCAGGCPDLTEMYGSADSAYDLSAGFFVAGGVSLIATVGYALFRPKASAATHGVRTMLVPNRSSATLTMGGEF